jgi:hypothetical protein
MELLIFVAALSLFAFLAMRFGYDSRQPADSKEQQLADLGMQLDNSAPVISIDERRTQSVLSLDLPAEPVEQICA